MNNIKTCEICGFQTDNGKIMSNHKRWKHISPKGSEAYNNCCQKISEASYRAERLKIKQTCPECGTEFTIIVEDFLYRQNRYRHYCSKSCANKQGSKYVDYSKVSEKQKEHPTGCYSMEWKLAHLDTKCAQKNFSKRELEIVSYFKENFPNDGWKQGFINGTHKNNGFILSPDLHSDKLKVVIEYDGIWHFKDIHNQLQHKQDVDNAMLLYCIEHKYRLIRIDEELNISNESISNAVYNSQKALELFGSKRYLYLKINEIVSK